MRHEANEAENKLLDMIVGHVRSEFCLIRMTHTMLKKSTIDANQQVSKMLSGGDFFDFATAVDGTKYYQQSSVLTQRGWTDRKTSFYRPKAKPGKPGDPRFWPSRFSDTAKEGDLVYLTVFDGALLIIPLRADLLQMGYLASKFGSASDVSSRLGEVIEKLKSLRGKWIRSCSPLKSNPKDVGDTLEAEFDLPINNLGMADYHGVELKTKRKRSKTNDTLFSQVPNPDISPCKTAKDVILKYGYDSSHPKRSGYKDLFVTVTNKPNPQGLYLEVNYEDELVEMRCNKASANDDADHLVAAWDFDLLKQRIYEKHSATAWIIADEALINNEIHFRYETLEISQRPLFAQFLQLIERGIVVFDWRGGYHPLGTGRVDKGHPFRLKGPKNRKLLFGSLEPIDLMV